jgi:hypothetical protein
MRFFIISFLSLLLSLTAMPVGAEYDFSANSGLNKMATEAGYETGNNSESLESNISRNITLVLSLVGVIFIILIIYAGINWMLAQGNEEKIGKAKKIIIDSSIGLTIVVAAYAITYFVLEFIIAKTWDG